MKTTNQAAFTNPLQEGASKMNDENTFSFWVKMFNPRTKKYQKETLRRLKNSVSPFETFEENQIKIKALKHILN